MKSLQFSLRQRLQNNFYFSPLITFSIREESMQPFLYPQETVLVNRVAKGKAGDIVVIRNPQKNSEQKYLIKKIEKVKNSTVYVVGMNKEKSIDSRHFGWIQKKDIIGKMIRKIS